MNESVQINCGAQKPIILEKTFWSIMEPVALRILISFKKEDPLAQIITERGAFTPNELANAALQQKVNSNLIPWQLAIFIRGLRPTGHKNLRWNFDVTQYLIYASEEDVRSLLSLHPSLKEPALIIWQALRELKPNPPFCWSAPCKNSGACALPC